MSRINVSEITTRKRMVQSDDLNALAAGSSLIESPPRAPELKLLASSSVSDSVLLRSSDCITIGDVSKQYEILRNIVYSETKDKQAKFWGSMLRVVVASLTSASLEEYPAEEYPAHASRQGRWNMQRVISPG